MALKEVEDIVKNAKKSKGGSTAKAVELAVNNAKEETSKDVRQLNENKWQITGKSVDEIRALSENLNRVKEQTMAMMKAAHEELWELITRKTGTSKNDSLSIEADHIKEGIIFLMRKGKGDREEDGPSGLAGLFRHIVERHLED